MMLSAYVITHNEERFLPQCLNFLCSVSQDVVVVDAHSTDRTAEIARNYPVRFFTRRMPARFAEQRNYAQLLCRGDWILTLDADELFAVNFKRLLPALLNDNRFHAYSFPRLALASPDAYTWKDDLDTQIRLYRRTNVWGHSSGGGLHECLFHDRQPLATHPAHVCPEVRYLHYPLLHYQLLKSDTELRKKAPAFLERQATDHPIQISDADWWVRAKQAVAPSVALDTWVNWLRFPPQSPEEKLSYLNNEDSRIDELVEYTGLPHDRIRNLLGSPVITVNAPPYYSLWNQKYLDAGGGEEAVVAQSFTGWLPWFCALTSHHLSDAAYQQNQARLLEAVTGCKRVLVLGAGLGDLVLKLRLRNPEMTVIYADVDGPAKRFFRWRRDRFGFKDIMMLTLVEALAETNCELILLEDRASELFQHSPRLRQALIESLPATSGAAILRST